MAVINENDPTVHDRWNERFAMNGTGELLDAIFAADPGALAVVSGPELVFRMANPAYCALLPQDAGSPVGRAYDEVWQSGDAARLSGRIREAVEQGAPLSEETMQLTLPDGARRYVSFRARPLRWQGEQGALLVVWDLTAQEQARLRAEAAGEEANRRALELLTVLNTMPDAIVIYDENGQVTSANDAARSLLGFDPVSISREQVLEKLKIRRADGRRAAIHDLPAALAFKGQRPPDQQLILEVGEGRRLQVRSSATPLFIGERLAGVVAVWSDITELVQRRQELEAVVQMTSALRSAIVQEEMFPIALGQIMDLLQSQGASILTPDGASGDLVVRAAAGRWSQTVEQRLPSGMGISNQVISTGELYRSNDIQSDERLARAIFTGDLPCGVCVPLRVHDTTIGVLWVGRRNPFADEEIPLLLALADIAASGLFRARLFDQTQLRLQRLSALHSIDMAITSSLDLSLTLNVLLDQVVSQMGVDAADILFFDSSLQWLEFAAGRGYFSLPRHGSTFSLSETPAARCVFDRQILSVPDISSENFSGWLPEQEAFRAYFAAPLIAKGQVKGVLQLYQREVFAPDAEWLEFLETIATQAAIALDSADLFRRLQRTNDDLQQAYDATIEGWARALELRDRETEGHSRRVSEMTIQLARVLGVSDEEIPHYRRGVLLHDIGKMGIPDAILLKDGPLTTEEQEIMRRHPIYAYELLRPIAYLRQSLDIPYAHHEWWDGRGYPRGLKREEIPLSARIFAVVDVYDALTNERTYRPPWPEQKVMEYIRARAGSQFDPRVVEAFLHLQRSFRSRGAPSGTRRPGERFHGFR